MPSANDSLETILESMADQACRMRLIDDALCPPEPQLIDTCILQNLDWVDRQLEENGCVIWDDVKTERLSAQFGGEMASDLIDLGVIYKKFEILGHYPWVVCDTNFFEVSMFRGDKSVRLQEITSFFRGHQEDLSVQSFPGAAIGALMESGRSRVSPLILKYLGVESTDQLISDEGPLSFLQDHGDRRVAACAIVCNIPSIITTDRKTFWRHRGKLNDFGVQVMRPSELLDLYEPYWSALSREFDRRRSL